MKTAVFSTKPYDAKFLVAANASAGHELDFFEEKLSPHTAKLAEGHTAVCAFVNDILNARTLGCPRSPECPLCGVALRGIQPGRPAICFLLGNEDRPCPGLLAVCVAEFALALVLP